MLKYQKINNIHKDDIIDIGGKDKFRTKFTNLANIDGFNKVNIIGFIRDAEESSANFAFQSICTTLQKNGLPIPRDINTITNEKG